MTDRFDIDSLKLLENLHKFNNDFIFDVGLFIAYEFINGPLNIFGAFNFYDEYDNKKWNDAMKIQRFKNLCSNINIPFFDVKLQVIDNKLKYILDMNNCNNIACQKLLYFQLIFNNLEYIKVISYNNYILSSEGWYMFLLYMNYGSDYINHIEYSEIEIEIESSNLIRYANDYFIQLPKCYLTDIDAILYSSKTCDKGSKVTFVEFKSKGYQQNINYAKYALLQILYDNMKSQLNVYKELVRLSKNTFDVNFLEVFYVKTSGFYYFIGPNINCNYNIQSKYQEDFINILNIRNKFILKECKMVYNTYNTYNLTNNTTNTNINNKDSYKRYNNTIKGFIEVLNKYIDDVEISEMFDFNRCSENKIEKLFLYLTNNNINNVPIDSDSVRHKIYNNLGLQLKLVSTKGEKYIFNDYLKKWEKL